MDEMTVEQRLARVEAAVVELGWRTVQMTSHLGFAQGHPSVAALMNEQAERDRAAKAASA
jgi:hypothetical protein